MSDFNPKPNEKYKDKKSGNVFVVQEVSDSKVIIKRPNYNLTHEVSHEMLEKCYRPVK